LLSEKNSKERLADMSSQIWWNRYACSTLQNLLGLRQSSRCLAYFFGAADKEVSRQQANLETSD